jgi:hypothetical protein
MNRLSPGLLCAIRQCHCAMGTRPLFKNTRRAIWTSSPASGCSPAAAGHRFTASPNPGWRTPAAQTWRISQVMSAEFVEYFSMFATAFRYPFSSGVHVLSTASGSTAEPAFRSR